jgi:hypothetical protein
MTDGPEIQGGQSPQSRTPHWLETKRTVNRIFWGLVSICAGLALADLVYHRHTVFAFEAVPGFYGVFGFVVCVGLVLGAKELRKILKRDEDYYDR